MRIKKFDNKWLMGIIICGVVLFTLYLLKLIIPEFVVGVAEIDSIVKLGNFIDSNLITFYIFDCLMTFYVMYFYTCASCRKKKLNKFDIIIILIAIVILTILDLISYPVFFVFNLSSLIIIPLIILKKDKNLNRKTIFSTIFCFLAHNINQILSLGIRDISSMVIHDNTATFTILTIDLYIMIFLLYKLFNKEDKDNG